MQERIVAEEGQLRGDRALTISVSADCTVFSIQYSAAIVPSKGAVHKMILLEKERRAENYKLVGAGKSVSADCTPPLRRGEDELFRQTRGVLLTTFGLQTT